MTAERDNKIRFQLRPTIVGEAIMDRLSAQGVDRNAESRRWIELGFAAEQAGFRLDGVELRHADRAWHVQPSLHGIGDAAPPPAVVPAKARASEAPRPAAPEVRPHQSATVKQDSSDTVQTTDIDKPKEAETLQGRLRSLSA